MKREVCPSKPNIGRIYDYMLGGTQNYESDRLVTERLLELFPHIRIWTNLNRCFLKFIANKWADEGLTQVLDLGSGLPTQGHFNERLAHGRILFSDFDPSVVELAQELIKDRPNMRFLQADARAPEPILGEAGRFFGDDHRVGIGCIGLCYFLRDEELRELFAALHAFSAPGSQLAISNFIPAASGSALETAAREYARKVGTPLFPRQPQELEQLLGPWQVVKHLPLAAWLDLPQPAADEISRDSYRMAYGLLATC